MEMSSSRLDEASEELGTIQIPSTWRPAMEDPATMQLYFDVYAATAPPTSKLALEVLVALGSLRRSPSSRIYGCSESAVTNLPPARRPIAASSLNSTPRAGRAWASAFRNRLRPKAATRKARRQRPLVSTEAEQSGSSDSFADPA